MDLSHIKAVLWDLDNTLYRFTDHFIADCNDAAAKTFCVLKPDMPYEDALALAQKSYKEHKFSGNIFLEKYRFSYRDYHFLFHRHISPKSTIHNPETLQDLRSMTHLDHRLITNASRDWVYTILPHIGLSDFFDTDHIVAMEDVDFIPKARGPDMVQKACTTLSYKPEKIAIADDLHRNLKHPKDMGLTTILVHPHDADDHKYTYVDHKTDTLEDLIACFNKKTRLAS